MPESRESCPGIYCGVAPASGRKDYRGLYDFPPEFANKAFERGPGAFFWQHDRSICWIYLPARPATWSPWHIEPNANDGGHKWKWDGNLERPTLSPSLHWVGVWHGWFRDGQLKSC